MAYIIKNTSGLINTRLTDVGRRNLSQGNFNISYFQIGDSEVSYTAVPNYNLTNNNILMPAFNAQNDSGSPQSNKENIKYPYYVTGGEGNTYGLPFLDNRIEPVYNSAGLKGFFTGTTGNWEIQSTSGYVITAEYVVDMGNLLGQDTIDVTSISCAPSDATGTPSVGDYLVLYMNGDGICDSVTTVPIFSYRIQNIAGTTFTLDRNVPDYTGIATGGQLARAIIYPSGMTQLYDTVTPAPYWQTDTFNFESPCDVVNRENTLIWNMNIPWTESPAGVFSSTNEGYTDYGSVSYVGTKEYLGYNEPSGQTDTGEVYYYNSFDEKIVVTPKEQKEIAIIHYTNQDIDNVYGEKFSTVPYDPQNPTDNTGLARHFKLSLPTLMWHKSTGSTIGETFWIDPPNYDLCKPYYIKSKLNLDMNDPGIRYFNLWDLNPDANNNLNRVGKVFPDQQTIIIDDEEIVAALSYKSNRNWTLPAPKVALITPSTSEPGIMTGVTQYMWVTYLLSGFTGSLHCNYYSKVQGPDSGCTTTTQNVAIKFGNEFPFLTQGTIEGFSATSMKLLCQLVEGEGRPSPTEWREIDVTNDISGSFVSGFVTEESITGTTFIIDTTEYDAASIYDLSDYITLPPLNDTNNILNFGDEYFFYGDLETDISATIYEMRYLINLGRNQFTNTSNPTWTSGTTSYVTEIGLYDSNQDLIVISKLQSPELRQGIQQYVVKLDF